MSTASTHGIDSHHINVGQGDSAIHLLIQNPLVAKPLILCATLIDGGKNEGRHISSIKKCIEEIERDYTLPTGTTKLKFDSIVITHWDSDHYQGILKLIEEDLNPQLPKKPPVPPAVIPPADIAKIQCGFMKYGNTTDRSLPLTTLYAPYWTGTAKKPAGKRAKGSDTDRPPDLRENKTKGLMDYHYKVAKNKMDLWIDSLCKLSYEPAEMLGVNFLTNVRLNAGVDYKTVTTPKLLIDNVKHTYPVGIFCVASRGAVLGNPGPPFSLFVVDKKNDAKNWYSVCAVVLWKDTEQISHYFAGDAMFETENKITEWVAKGAVKTVPSIKLSHHGAATSTPTGLLKQFQPVNIIVSAGTSTNYGHPRWELLFYFNAWLLGRIDRSAGDLGVRPLYATQYPDYLVRGDRAEKFPAKNISPDSFLKPAKEDLVYLAELKAIYDTINAAANAAIPKLREYKDIKGQFDGWLAEQRSPPPTIVADYEDWLYNVRAWIDYQVECVWAAMTRMYVGTSSDPRNIQSNYITVKSRDGKVNKDGTVQVHFPSAVTVYTPIKIITAIHVVSATDPAYIDPGPLMQFSDIPADLLRIIPPGIVGGSLSMPSRGDTADTTGTVDTTSTADTTGFYIICSSLPHDDPSDPNVFQLSDGTPLNSFLTNLHSQKIGLTAAPAASSTSPFLDTDEWSLWLADAVSATSLVAKSDASGQVNGFALEINWPDSTADNPSTIKFDTDYVVPAFDIPPDATPPIGLLGDTDIIAFGLDPSQKLTLKTDLKGAFEYVGLENLASSPLVVALGPQLGLTLASDIGISTGARNVIWFDPRQTYRTTIRLQWKIDDVNSVKNYINFLKGSFELGEVYLITRRTSTWEMGPEGINVMVEGEAILSAEFKIAGKTFISALTFNEDSIRMDLTTNENVFQAIADWLIDSIGDIPFAGWLVSAGAAVFRNLYLRRITMTVKEVDGTRKITSFSVATEIEMGLGGTPDNPARVLLTYAGTGGVGMGKLRGQLWFYPPPTYPPLLFPGWEKCQDLSPVSPGQSTTLDLAKLHPDGVADIPEGIPHQVTDAFFEVDSKTVSFFGQITCEAPAPSSVPSITLGLVSLDAKYTFGGEDPDAKGQLDLALIINIDIQAPESSAFQTPTTIVGSLEYHDGAWKLFGSMSPIFVGTLYQFFDPDASGGVMTLLEALEVQELKLEYNYQKGVANNFRFDGILALGELELDLQYTYDTGGWEFSAALGATSATSTLGSVIQSITGDDEDILPGFVSDIPIAAAGEGGAVSVRCSKQPKEKKEGDTSPVKPEDFILFFSATVAIKPLKATFVQYRDVGWLATVAPKRVFKVSVTELPAVDVPLVGNLTQPFDEMFYMWVQDTALQTSTNKLPGLADSEVVYINKGLQVTPGGVQTDELLFKETRKEEAKKATDVVITAGSHFVLVLQVKETRKVVLDYKFESKKKTGGASMGMLTETESGEEEDENSRALIRAGETPDPGGKGDSAMAPYTKTVGPISISNIGFQYKGDTLSILLDAAFLLGPIGFTLIGFSIDVNLSGATLQNLPLPSFSLNGLAVSFDQPPIRIAGLYTHVKNETIEYYAGGVIVSFTPYLFQAAGFYGETKKPTQFTSVFVFGKLEGPLITLAFAEISGITGGFGYNTDMRFPAIEQVPEFPFVAGTGVGDDIMATLKNLVTPGPNGWFSPRDGSFWFAAGMQITAFETLSIDAVVVVQWNPYVKLGIFGVAVVDIPKGVSTKFAHIELGISAVVDFEAGVMKFEAQLSPNSYIFAPSCHLTGGFALYYWFKGADPALEGDWVFTIGGFHRAFNRPSHYPNPPRLAISWSVDSAISITGESYFAITPKCCMGGGRLRATLKLGPLSAWFDAYADFLINYKPFHFMADGGVSVGISCKVDLLITSFTIKVEIGAQLHLEGPPLCGRVHVDFWIVAFDIDFGPSPQGTKPISLDAFYLLVLQAGEGAAMSRARGFVEGEVEEEEEAEMARGGETNSEYQDAHVFGCRSGLMEGNGSQETEQNKEWEVRSGTFSFEVSCRFAIGKGTVMPSDEFPASRAEEVPVTEPVTWDTPIYAKPMQLTAGLTSEIEISVNRTEASRAAKSGEEFVEPQWQVKPIMKSVPSALWGQYKRDQDPQYNGNNVPALLNGDGVAIPLLMGIEITAPKPTLSQDQIPKFNAVDAMSQSVSVQGQEPIFPKYGDAVNTWSPAAVEDFDGQWKKVSDLWETPEAGVQSRQKTLDLWMDTMFWPKEKALKGDAPEILLKKFDNLYLLAPMISVG